MKHVKPFVSLLLPSIASITCMSAFAAPKANPDIPYRTVAAAFADLRKQSVANPDKVRIETTPDGWQLVYQTKDDNMVVWSFTPSSDPAYPAVVRREVRVTRQQAGISMAGLCEAKKEAACDALFDYFKAMNQNAMDEAKAASTVSPTAVVASAPLVEQSVVAPKQ